MTRILIAAMTIFTLSAAPALAVEFPHALHLKVLQGLACTTCHVETASGHKIVLKPERKVCLQCHDPGDIKDVKFPGLKTIGPSPNQVIRSTTAPPVTSKKTAWSVTRPGMSMRWAPSTTRWSTSTPRTSP